MKKTSLTFLICCLLLSSSSIFSQPPSVIVWPAKVWLESHNYLIVRENQGKVFREEDLESALLNQDLYSVINKISQLMNDKKFPLVDLASTLSSIKDKSALDNAEEFEGGQEIVETGEQKLLKQARPDIKLEVNWEVITEGPMKQVKFELKGIDAATHKPIAVATGLGKKMIGASLPSMLETGVLDQLDNFCAQLQAYKDDMKENGREIAVTIKVLPNSPKKLNDQINDEGDFFKDDLKKWMKKNTVKGKCSLDKSDPNLLMFSQVRIPLTDEEGESLDGDGFATKLRKYVIKTYKITCDSRCIGLGDAEVYIGGKKKQQ